MVIDNYDSFSEESGRMSSVLDSLAVMAREFGTGGLHYLVAGSVSAMLGADALKKQVASSSYGLGLLTAESAERLNGRVPRALSEVELPAGRAFIVKSGRTSMVQVATPYTGDDAIESSLDEWVSRILRQYPVAKNTWSSAPQAAGEAPAAGGSLPGASQPAPAPAARVPEIKPLDSIDEARKVLKEHGYEDSILQMFSENQVLLMAKNYTAVSAQPEKPSSPGEPAPAADGKTQNPA